MSGLNQAAATTTATTTATKVATTVAEAGKTPTFIRLKQQSIIIFVKIFSL